MNIIYPENLKNNLMNQLHHCYVLLGEDVFLLNQSQDIILKYAYKKNFLEKIIIKIKKNTDWNQVNQFYKTKHLFFNKKILIINFSIKKLTIFLIQEINKIYFSKKLEILIILKFNELSNTLKKNKKLKIFESKKNIIYCFTPRNLNFENWIKYEIKEKKLKVTENSFHLLKKNYEGNTLFLHQTLNIISSIWKNEIITSKKIKKIINQFSIFSPSIWIDAIFRNDQKRALYILDSLYKKKYNPIILIRSLQKDLIKLINIKRETKISINESLKKNNIWTNRSSIFINALKFINFNNLLKVIRILLKIEIDIKKEYNYSVWMELKTITLLLFL
ncbi:DNA polymerase III subunit delta [Buchnera aphidicola (Melanaphis sacchari)]|uniref:DNA polymerase III subunit delta n=1 Tax=Buchnera aphidicola (Melanaphis sacchari) TaxID=2173854 RepID=A0A2U8DEU0_9GAMM|nr:DNA polymerase III subunit delta [Buchnera aphidicola]AWH90358.1 DNA polymerase III subunit delta [Buchnera aphidicola (Melanaphis sacchari)]